MFFLKITFKATANQAPRKAPKLFIPKSMLQGSGETV